ncbi:MAG: guanylate kinase [Bacteriovoracaceae bacterium]
MKKYKGKIIVIVAPSGTGKSTLIKQLKAEFKNLSESISYTTRAMRTGEKDGVNYFFVNPEQFKKMIENNELIEWATVHSNYYGTSRKFVEESLEAGKILLFDLDVQGTDSMKKLFGGFAQVVFIEPPSLQHLEDRLVKRGTDSRAVIDERLQNAKKELTRKNDYDYLVMNENFDTTLVKLKEIFRKIISE